MTDGPLIVQSDKSLLLEVAHERAAAARAAIAPFAELERAPEHMHTYRITDLGLWNARAAGYDAESVIAALVDHSRYPVPHALLLDVADTMDRYGRLRLEADPHHGLVLRTTDRPVLEEVLRSKRVQGMVGARIDEDTSAVHPSERGALKQALLKLGWPAEDHAGYVDGEAHPIALAEDGWTLRPYQQEAVDGFRHGGSGVVVLPCGAGKTIVGAGAMAAMGRTTLILVTNTVSARQWRDELLERFGLDFAIIDRAYLTEQRKLNGFAVNPWNTHTHFVLSHALLRDEAYTRAETLVLVCLRSVWQRESTAGEPSARVDVEEVEQTVLTYFTESDGDIARRQKSVRRALERLRHEGIVEEETEGRYLISPLIEIVLSAQKLRELADWLSAQTAQSGELQ